MFTVCSGRNNGHRDFVMGGVDLWSPALTVYQSRASFWPRRDDSAATRCYHRAARVTLTNHAKVSPFSGPLVVESHALKSTTPAVDLSCSPGKPGAEPRSLQATPPYCHVSFAALQSHSLMHGLQKGEHTHTHTQTYIPRNPHTLSQAALPVVLFCCLYMMRNQSFQSMRLKKEGCFLRKQ